MRTRSEALALLRDRTAARKVEGGFLAFLMIPVIDRFGQWRFAGAATNLDEALERMRALATALVPDTAISLHELAEPLDWPASPEDSWSIGYLLERPGLEEAVVEVLAEGGAPYDHEGLAVLSVDELSTHPYATRGIESRRPEAWDGGDFEADLDRPPDAWIE